MEADSVHSQIERQVRNNIFNVPADYCLAMKMLGETHSPTLSNTWNTVFSKTMKVHLKPLSLSDLGRKLVTHASPT